jgi:hypothetical protein
MKESSSWLTNQFLVQKYLRMSPFICLVIVLMLSDFHFPEYRVILIDGKAELVFIENMQDDGTFSYDAFRCHSRDELKTRNVEYLTRRQEGISAKLLDKLFTAAEKVIEILLKEKVRIPNLNLESHSAVVQLFASNRTRGFFLRRR